MKEVGEEGWESKAFLSLSMDHSDLPTLGDVYVRVADLLQ